MKAMKSLICMVAMVLAIPANAQTEETDTLAQDNDLCGTYLSLVLTSGNATLNNGTNGLGFYPISSSATAKANTAYFPISTQLLLDLESLDDVPTAIENTPMTQKEVAYDLSGRRIKNPARGLYVTRGRKYIKK